VTEKEERRKTKEFKNGRMKERDELRNRGNREVLGEGGGGYSVVTDVYVPSCMRCTSFVWNSPSVQTFFIIWEGREGWGRKRECVREKNRKKEKERGRTG
jgi:hypothetical protein